MDTNVEHFLTMNVGIDFEIIEMKDITIETNKFGEAYSIFRNDKSLKQFTLYSLLSLLKIPRKQKKLTKIDVFNSCFKEEKKIGLVVKRLQAIKQANSLPILKIINVHQYAQGILILCGDSFSFEDRLLNKITSDEAKYFLADFNRIIESINVLPAYVSCSSLVFMQDSISTAYKLRCDEPTSPIPHLLLSPLAFILPMTSSPLVSVTKSTSALLSIIADIISKVNVEEENDISFVAESMKFISTKEPFSIEELNKTTFLKGCEEFQSLPHGNLDDYTPVEFISNGACGLVMKVERNGKYYAMKQSCRADILIREAHAMKLFNHPNLMTLVDYIESSESYVSRLGIRTNRSKKYYYIVMEYCNHGTLADYVQKNQLNEDEIMYFITEINNGLKYLLKSKMMVHRDIKLDNILLTSIPESKDEFPFNLQVKIADYGFCRAINSGIEHGVVGTPLYLCPEICNNSSPSVKSDLYSVGVMLFRMVCGKFPNGMEENVGNENWRIEFPQEVIENTRYDNIRNLISHLIQKEPMRLDWNSYFKHPFFVHY